MADTKKTPTTAPARKRAPSAKVATKAASRSETQVEKTTAAPTALVPSKEPSRPAATAPEPAPTLFAVSKPDQKKPDQKPDPIADAVARVAAPVLQPARAVVETSSVTVVAATEMAVPATRLIEAGAEQARDAYARTRAATTSLREAFAESANATTRGALEVNGKVIEAWRAQSDAAFDVLQSALRATTLSDAIRVQTSGARQVYETAAAHWKDLAETTTRWFGTAIKPIQSVLTKND